MAIRECTYLLVRRAKRGRGTCNFKNCIKQLYHDKQEKIFKRNGHHRWHVPVPRCICTNEKARTQAFTRTCKTNKGELVLVYWPPDVGAVILKANSWKICAA